MTYQISQRIKGQCCLTLNLLHLLSYLIFQLNIFVHFPAIWITNRNMELNI